jgi:hypothetical protein
MNRLWAVIEEAWWRCITRRYSDSIYVCLLWGQTLRRVL